MASNDRVGVAIKQPRADEERFDAAKKCSAALEISMPVLVDAIDDRVGHAYSGMPDRLYIIDRAGRVAYKSGRGPFGFKPGEMEQSLVMLLLDQDQQAKKPARVPLLSDEEAWKRLPPLEQGKEQPLPHWARALAGALPRTTAMMLELDDVQRTKSPLDPKLRAELRLVAAHANRSPYGRTYAESDLKSRGGIAFDPKLMPWEAIHLKYTTPERAALLFAWKLSLTPWDVTDEEVAELIKHYGEKQVVAMVALLAYANFQDRLLLSLGVEVEPGGPLKPLGVKFKRQPVEGRAVAPPRKAPESAPASSVAEKITDPEWLAAKFEDLQASMNTQRARQPRIRVPDWEEAKKNLPPAAAATANPVRIRWSLVGMVYQPELTGAWFNAMRTFGQEARHDRVFQETLFWVITRSLKCFY